MPSWTTYKGMTIPDATPGQGGTYLNDDIKELANRTTGTTGSVIFVGAGADFPITQNNTRLFWNNSAFRLRVNTTSEFTAALNVSPSVNTDAGLVVRGAASQSANYFAIQKSDGTPLVAVDNTGALELSGGNYSDGCLAIPSWPSDDSTGPISSAGRTLLGMTDDNRTLLNASSATGGKFQFITGGSYSSAALATVTNAGKVGIGVDPPTALLHLKAGAASANSAPLKLTSGTNLTSAEAGAMEYNNELYFTPSSGTRCQVAYIDRAQTISANQTLAEGVNLAVGTSTGTQIGTSSSQKLGLFGATPIVRPTVSGSRGGNAALASLLMALANLGLIVDSTT